MRHTLFGVLQLPENGRHQHMHTDVHTWQQLEALASMVTKSGTENALWLNGCPLQIYYEINTLVFVQNVIKWLHSSHHA